MKLTVLFSSLFLTFLSNEKVSASPGALGLQYNKRDNDIAKTCTATHVTTIAISTIPVTVTTYSLETITTVATIPHSCFTYLEATSQSDNAFCGTINLATCGPTPDCILEKTITFPCHDPCCPTTKTVKTPGGCLSCQKGCATATIIATASSCDAVPTTSGY